MDWESYRYFAAIARTGSVRGAAQVLRVNPSTVTRRLEQLESELGVTLFSRSSRGLTITTEGVEVAQHVDEAARHFGLLESSLRGRDQRLSGAIRVAVPEVLAVHFLLEDLAPFAHMYPNVELELYPAYRGSDLTRRDVDVVIAATDTPPEMMIGRQLTRLALAAYGSRDYVEEYLSGEAVEGLAWVDWAGDGEVPDHYRKLRQRYFPEVRVHLRCDNVEMHRAALVASMGLGILPVFVGDAEARLQRLDLMPVVQSPLLWILTHPEQRSVRRLQIFLEYLREVFASRRNELVGE